MKEFLKTLFDNTTERVKSPFISSFTISWIVINWKGIAYFLRSKEDIDTILKTLRTEYYQEGSYWYWLMPLIFAIFYVSFLPYINLVFDKISYWARENRKKGTIKFRSNEYKEMIQLAKNKAAFEFEQSNYESIREANKEQERLSEENKNLKEKIQIDRNEYNKEIERLGKSLESKEQRFKEYISNTKNIYSNSWVKKFEEEYLKEFKQERVFSLFQTLADNLKKEGHVMVGLSQNDIDEFNELGVLKVQPGTNHLEYYWEEKGKAFWILYQLDDKDFQVEREPGPARPFSPGDY